MPSGSLALQDALHRRDGERLEIDRVRDPGVGHDRGRVGVEQDGPDALLAERAAGLGAGVVELGRLADDHRPGADDEHRGRLGRRRRPGCRRDPGRLAHPAAPMRARKRSKTSTASSGPGEPSGWYCTVSMGSVVVAQPLDAAVVEVALADREAGAAWQRVGVHRDLVVLGRDLHPSGAQVLHRMVRAVMPEAQAARLGARGAGHDLVAQADAQERPAIGDDRRAPARSGRPAAPGHRGRATAPRPATSGRSTSAAVAVCGSTRTRAPRRRSERTMFALSP